MSHCMTTLRMYSHSRRRTNTHILLYCIGCVLIAGAISTHMSRKKYKLIKECVGERKLGKW